MNTHHPVPRSGGSSDGFELAGLAFFALVIGPFTLAAAFLLALVTSSRSRLWLWGASVPGAVGAFFLWPFASRHLEAAALTLGHTVATDPGALPHAVWPHLWPAWLATLTVAPLIALVVHARQSENTLASIPGEAERRRAERLERSAARKARSAAQLVEGADGVFLGYPLGGDPLLPTKRGRVFLPLARLSHHLLVTGTTGSGKTETVLRVADSLARSNDWRLIYIDGKGDRENKERFQALMQAAGRSVHAFPDHAYDGWRGSTEEIAGRLLQLIDFAHEGGGAFYRDLAVNTVRLACEAPPGPPRNSRELLERLDRETLIKLHPRGSTQAAEAAALQRDQMDGIRARYAAFFNTVRGALDGHVGFDETDTSYFLLDGLRLKFEAGYLARFLVEEFTQWAVARKPRGQRVLLIVDEFSAIAQASHGLVDVVERTRGFGVACALCPQLAEGMGNPEAAARIVGSAQTILLHAMPTPEQFVRAAGTRNIHFLTRQLEGDAFTGRGSTRVEDEYRVDPNEVRRLRVGQCFAIGSGLAMKLQVAPAPPLTSLHE